MVPAMLVGGGGAGGMVSIADMDCTQIYGCFDPPIVCGSYKDVKKQIKGSGDQAEHLPPNSCFVTPPRAGGNAIPGCSGYTEGNAFSYNVFDGQTKFTQHKMLTDGARSIAKGFEGRSGPDNGTLNEWLDKSRDKIKDALKDKSGGAGGRGRIKGGENMSDEDKDALAAAAADCLVQAAKDHYADESTGDVTGDTPLRNGILPRRPSPPTSPGTQGGGGYP